jgi:hypothetical protein
VTTPVYWCNTPVAHGSGHRLPLSRDCHVTVTRIQGKAREVDGPIGAFERVIPTLSGLRRHLTRSPLLRCAIPSAHICRLGLLALHGAALHMGRHPASNRQITYESERRESPMT